MSALIQTDRLHLRLIDPDHDAADMLALLNEPGFIRHIADRGVRTLAQARDYTAERVLGSYTLNGFGMYAVIRRSDGAWLGNAGLVRRDGLPAPDVGYALRAQYEGNGYALEAARAVMHYARDVLGYTDLYGIVAPENLRSAALLRKLGMEDRGDLRLPGPRDEEVLLLFATPGAPAVVGA
ncbi:MAG: GNAT family N-acetyltransferase [Stenotrophomonas sp.]|uniref:GNAT family N-acetyltransferase n=1 Tax=Stenotrophomonas sp. TaxID=69392 RepID=UPI003D6CCCAB